MKSVAASSEHRSGTGLGADVLAGGVHFRVWAPGASIVEAMIEGRGLHPLFPEGRGFFSGFAPGVRAGDLYWYRLDKRDSYPDPVSRFQPDGPSGPSEAVDPGLFPWTDANWPGITMKGQVIYEMHIGTFTREGTWEAASRQLWELKELGVTTIELMPVADFPGSFGWGYDNVNLFAPTRLYGRPDDFRAFIDRAHALGLGVILDVVYNHTGPQWCVLSEFSGHYYTDKYENEWGTAINFDGEGSGPVREFFIENARYWIREFHMDGLRLDATQMIFDSSRTHIIKEIAEAVRSAADGRSTIVIAENEPQDVKLASSIEEGGFGVDALWNDDFHHSARVAMTGRREGYYTDYNGRPQELVSAVKWGYLYQGQYYIWQKKRRGTPALRVMPYRFVNYLQNHDQVANSATGQRLHELTSPGRLRAMTALLLLAPSTPLLFQGQEFASSRPFLYFCDLGPDIVDSVKRGRENFLKQFRSIAATETSQALSDPSDPVTFEACKLDSAERLSNRGIYQLHKDLLSIRRGDPVISLQTDEVDGAVLSAEAFALRFFGDSEDRLLVVNLGPDLSLVPCPEPLLAPEEGKVWNIMWSSEHPAYNGNGTPVLDEALWVVPGHSAVLLGPVKRQEGA